MVEHVWKSDVRCSLCVQFSSFSTVLKQQVSLSFKRMTFSVNSCGLLQFSAVDVTVKLTSLCTVWSYTWFKASRGSMWFLEWESGFFTRACSWPHKHSGYHKTNSVPNLMVHFSSCTMSFWRVHAYVLLLGFLRHWASLAQPQVILQTQAISFYTTKLWNSETSVKKDCTVSSL